ncbi:MAG: hypothetical protein ABW195_09160 [Ilumatobacteraceae bacterium]
MTAGAGPSPLVAATTVGPGHDGRAELVVELVHSNGARSTISVDEEALGHLLDRTDVTSVDDLLGRRWPDLTHPSDPPV